MAYASSRSPSQRATTIIAVTALQAAALYGIMLGLTVTGIFTPRTRVEGGQIPLPPPPKPVDRPKDTHPPIAEHTSDPVIPPDPGTQVNPNDQGGEVIVGPAPGGGVIVEPTATPTVTPSPPAFTPRAVRQRGRPGEWVTTNDYPSQDIREGNQGVVGFRLGVNAEGRVSSCTITRSSGFARLDATACAKLTARARFDPATDETGARVSGSYASAVRWTIPN